MGVGPVSRGELQGVPKVWGWVRWGCGGVAAACVVGGGESLDQYAGADAVRRGNGDGAAREGCEAEGRLGLLRLQRPLEREADRASGELLQLPRAACGGGYDVRAVLSDADWAGEGEG